jgi:exodeoxyribonuclease-3
MPLSIATWNINSVRLRMPIVERFLKTHAPDILCLQETKCPDDFFPHEAFQALGYEHIAISGQKGYHGVATVARRPITVVDRRRFCEVPDCRRRTRSGDQSEIPAQARFRFRNERDHCRDGRCLRIDPRRRPQHRAAGA